MKIGRIWRTFLVGFIVLLGIQLAGLNCLDDWAIGSFVGTLPVHELLSGSTNGTDRLIDDGCPCHLSLAPVYRCSIQIGHPFQPNTLDAPATYTLALASLPFHPPVLL